MPFLSSSLDYAREQADGTFICRETHIDQQGVRHVYGPYVAASVAAAEALRDNRFTNSLQTRRQAEIRVIVRHFRGGGLWSDYDLNTFATKDKARTRLLKLFGRSNYPRKEPEIVSYARTVVPLAASKVKTLLGLANDAEGQAVIDRAQAALDHWDATLNWDSDIVEDDGTE